MVKKNREMVEAPAVYVDLTENQAVSDNVNAANDQKKPSLDELSATLNKICEQEDLMGYILRDDATAKINLKDSSKIIDFAMLSSQAFESAAELSASFKLGNMTSIVIEGTYAIVLCVSMGENSASIFMEKTANPADILDKIALI